MTGDEVHANACLRPDVAEKMQCSMLMKLEDGPTACSDPDSREECGNKIGRLGLSGGQLMKRHGFVPVNSPGDAGL